MVAAFGLRVASETKNIRSAEPTTIGTAPPQQIEERRDAPLKCLLIVGELEVHGVRRRALAHAVRGTAPALWPAYVRGLAYLGQGSGGFFPGGVLAHGGRRQRRRPRIVDVISRTVRPASPTIR